MGDVFFKSELPSNRTLQPTVPTAINAKTVEADATPDVEAVEYRSWSRPPGLIGDIADFMYGAAPKPLFEVALAGAIAYFAGIVGRAYNVEGMGLNQYIVVLADTGAGKNAAKTGIDKLNSALEPMLAHGISLRKGLGVIASPQGLLKSLAGDDKHPARLCCSSVFGEVGLWLQELCDNRADANKKALRRMLLDLYTSSGGSKRFGDVGYSDTLKNVKEIIAPAYSFIGDSTQHAFYKAVSEDSVAEGFLTRITLIEYPLRKLPEPNPNHNNVQPPVALLNSLGGLVRQVTEFEGIADNTCIYRWTNVPFDDATRLHNVKLERDIRLKMEQFNATGEFHLSSIWTRFQEKTMRLAALLAVGVDPNNPQITMAEMMWAHDLVMRGTEVLIKRFRSGNVGETSDGFKQRQTVRDFLYAYAHSQWTPRLEKSYRLTAAHHELKILTKSYIQQRLIQSSAFAKERHDATAALTRAIDHFVAIEALQEYDVKTLYSGRRGAKAYQIVDVGKLRSP